MAAWVLNLDADLELAARGPYAPTARTRAAMAPHVERLRASLLRPGDVVVDDASGQVVSVGPRRGRAFCPTPRALALLRRAGAVPDPSPSVEVLRRVNSREFASGLGATLPGAAFLKTEDAVREAAGRKPEVGTGWRVKYAHGMTGRNQRVISVGTTDERDWAFVRAGLAGAGVQVEPDVVILVEYAVHGVIAEDGGARFGRVVRQTCDARGAWVATEPLRVDDAPSEEIRAALEVGVRHVAGALFAAGYHGPFGIDAFTFRGPDGQPRLQPRSEINARYAMGFAVGYGRPD